MSHTAPLFPQRAFVKDGVFYFEDGGEVVLWGVNFQSCLYWEQGFRREPLGLPGDAASIRAMAERGFADLRRLGCDLIRVHLTPADYTDEAGNLIANQWLDLIGYTLAQARANGIYVTLAFLNQMEFSLVRRSFIANCPRREWLFDARCVQASHNFIGHLLDWMNPYTGMRLADDLTVITWEPINEPEYISYQDMKGSPAYREEFSGWVDEHRAAFNDWYYQLWREEKVRGAINNFHALLRIKGAVQPMVWNCNWPRMVDGHHDVFRAVAASSADAVAFCCYPGQDEVSDPFLQGARDTSGKNYLPFLRRCHDDELHLGWVNRNAFRHKAVSVYEFETMYNAKNSYLHPALAKMFRSLRAQMATLWTYSFEDYAPRFSGSHLFNLKCTPRKAAGFLVAGEIFRRLARGEPYSTTSDAEDVFGDFMYSSARDLAVSVHAARLIHSGPLGGCPLPLPTTPRQIVGVGSSPLAASDGTGLYFLDIGEEEIRLEILPNTRFVRDPWQWWMDGKPVTELDASTPVQFRLSLPGWMNAGVFRYDNGHRTPVAVIGPGPAFVSPPGIFSILK